jgi:hypothetical protein
LDRAGISVPCQQIAYRGLTVTRAASAGASAAVPTTASALRDALRTVMGRGRAESVTVLAGVDGVLK